MPDSPADDNTSIRSVFRNRWVKFALIAMPCLALAVWLIVRLSSVLIPFGLAIAGAYILNPTVQFLQAKLKWPRVPVVVLLVVSLSVVLVTSASLAIYYTISTIERMVPGAEEEVAPAAGTAAPGDDPAPEPRTVWTKLRDAVESLPATVRKQVYAAIDELPSTVTQHFREISGSVLKVIAGIASTLLALVLASFNFVVFFVVMAYILADLPRLRDGAAELLPVRHKAEMLRIAKEIDTNLRAFFRGQVLVALSLGVIYSAGLMLCGVDFGLIIGMVAGIVSVVPYLGLAVGVAPALLFAMVPFNGFLAPLGVIATFTIGQSIEGLYLTPKIIGRNVGLSPVVVILSIMIFGQLLGGIGVIFAVPLAAVAKVFIGELLLRYRADQKRIALEMAGESDQIAAPERIPGQD